MRNTLNRKWLGRYSKKSVLSKIGSGRVRIPDGPKNSRKGDECNDPYFSRIDDVPLISKVSPNRRVFVEASRPRPRDLLLRWAFHRVMMGSRPRPASIRNIVLPFRYLRMISSDQVFVASRGTVAGRILPNWLVLVCLPGWLDPAILETNRSIKRNWIVGVLYRLQFYFTHLLRLLVSDI